MRRDGDRFLRQFWLGNRQFYGVDKAVSPARHGFQKAGVDRIIVKGLADFFDRRIDCRVELNDNFVAPKFVLQLLPGDKLSRAFKKDGQDIAGLAYKLHGQAVFGQTPCVRIDLEVSKPYDHPLRYIYRAQRTATGYDPPSIALTGIDSPLSLALNPWGDLLIAQSGTSSLAAITWVPFPAQTPIGFATTQVNPVNTAPAITIPVENVANQPLTISSVTFPPANFVEVSDGDETCEAQSTLSPGQTCTVAAVFNPQTAGNLTGVITIADNAQNISTSTQTISLNGRAVLAPTVTFPGDPEVVSPGAVSERRPLRGSPSPSH